MWIAQPLRPKARRCVKFWMLSLNPMTACALIFLMIKLALRKHMTILVDGKRVSDLAGLSDPVQPKSEVYVLQALSGG